LAAVYFGVNCLILNISRVNSKVLLLHAVLLKINSTDLLWQSYEWICDITFLIKCRQRQMSSGLWHCVVYKHFRGTYCFHFQGRRLKCVACIVCFPNIGTY
jgi:hypothetical protein